MCSVEDYFVERTTVDSVYFHGVAPCTDDDDALSATVDVGYSRFDAVDCTLSGYYVRKVAGPTLIEGAHFVGGFVDRRCVDPPRLVGGGYECIVAIDFVSGGTVKSLNEKSSTKRANALWLTQFMAKYRAPAGRAQV